ncbi:MAG: PrgI family protein [bacterium]|nr:PrgI family protein [bacterium]
MEDKIIGPITTRQFIIGIGAMLLVFLSYKFADTALFIIQAILILGIYALVAFIKINGRPFYQFILSVGRSVVRPQLRIWSRQYSPKGAQKTDAGPDTEAITQAKPRLRSQALSELTLLVDTGGKYRSEEIFQKQHAKK